MAYGHGKDSVVKLDNSAGSLTNITAYVTECNFARVADTAETSTMGDSAKEYIPGMTDATFNLGGIFDATVDVILDAAVGVQRTFEYNPLGTGTGAPKYTVEAICTSYDPPSTISDAVKWQASFQCTGAITRTTN